MSSKATHSNSITRDGKPLRSERRRLAREVSHSHARGAVQRQRSNTLPALVLTLGSLAFLAFLAFLWAWQRETTSSPRAAAAPPKPALTVPSSLNPVPNLLKAGSLAPNFTVTDTTGDTFSLLEQRGHPVLIEFFALWCPRCHEEAPTMHRLAANFGTKHVTVLAIMANPYGPDYEVSRGKDLSLATSADVNWYRSAYGANYPLLVDRHFQAVNRYGAGSYPTLYMINSTGHIIYRESGVIPYSVAAAHLKQTIASAK